MMQVALLLFNQCHIFVAILGAGDGNLLQGDTLPLLGDRVQIWVPLYLH